MNSNENSFDRLVKIMEKLRGPNGCPWDLEQNSESIKHYLIEEAYEAIEAIEENDVEKIKEELGDVLLQVVFHAQMAKENKLFTIEDVVNKICNKLITRHPHVFGEDHQKLKSSIEVLNQWSQIKLKEKGRKSVLDGVPKTLPSLQRAHRLGEKAARVGFDWPTLKEVREKLDEELKEFDDAVLSKDHQKIEEELGDVFLILANMARFLKIDPEGATRKSVNKFITRFNYIENSLLKSQKDIHKTSLTELEALWSEAKKNL